MVKSKKEKAKQPWQDIVKEVQDYRDASLDRIQPSIPLFGEPLPENSMGLHTNVLSQLEIQVTEMLPEHLLSKMASGELSAMTVITAFLRRAVLVQRLANCVTELLPERALARASYLDTYFIRNERPIGPFHGLPISVKEHIYMKGLSLNAGYVAWHDKVAEEDAHILQILWNAGAVFHARTTEPQSMMHLETNSNLYGLTVNPYNREFSAGGSSGGEGALIALRGSCLGIGTDIGGSIRSPAANNGLYGLKPTGFRLPTDGCSAVMAGVDPISTVIGPLSVNLWTINHFMATIINAKPWLSEPALIPMPWRTTTILPNQPLKIAIMWHDKIVKPHPPVTRALQALASRLNTLPNVSVTNWEPYLHDEAWAIISSLYFPDGGTEDASVIDSSGEPWLPLTKFIMKENPCVKKLSMQKFQYWQEEREAYRSEYAKAWNRTAIDWNQQTGDMHGTVDCILCPVGPGVAPRHGTARYWGYTCQWNLLDYPAVVFPVDKVDPEVDKVEVNYEPMNELDEQNWALYDDPIAFAGLPISLQLVGRRFEDEKIVAILEYIKEQVGLPFVPFP